MFKVLSKTNRLTHRLSAAQHHLFLTSSKLRSWLMAQMSGLITLLSVSSSSLVTCFTSVMLLSLPSSSFSSPSTSLTPSLQSEPAPLSHSPEMETLIISIPILIVIANLFGIGIAISLPVSKISTNLSLSRSLQMHFPNSLSLLRLFFDSIQRHFGICVAQCCCFLLLMKKLVIFREVFKYLP